MRVAGKLGRYFGLRFLMSSLAAFFGVMMLVALIDYIELMRKTSGVADVSAVTVAATSFLRVPQVTERIMSFCVLVGAMSSYLSLSRRNELVIARAAGMSAWEFTMPAVLVALALGVIGTTIYNPVAANMFERAKRQEAEIFRGQQSGLQESTNGFWIRQRSNDGQSIINAKSSREQGARLSGVTVFTYDASGKFLERIEAKSAELTPGAWQLSDARIFGDGTAPLQRESYSVATNLTPAQVRESFATPETVPFWQLPAYIGMADNAGLAGSGYRLQYQKLLARPFLLASMVLLAAAFSLRFFRMGGVQQMVLAGVASGFALYVLSKITEDLSKASLLPPSAAAWLPVVIGALIGLLALLYQEDG